MEGAWGALRSCGRRLGGKQACVGVQVAAGQGCDPTGAGGGGTEAPPHTHRLVDLKSYIPLGAGDEGTQSLLVVGVGG